MTVEATGTPGEGGYEYAIEAVQKAARTLLMLRDRPSIRAIDVSTELGVARSTAHRMVSTLAQEGLLQRNSPDKTYSAGPALVELGMAVVDGADIRPVVQPVLSRLAAETGETAHYLVREGDEVVFIAVAEGTFIIRAASRVGSRLPAHTTAAGKCLLAALSADELEAMYPSDRRLTAGTHSAIHGRKRLFDELERVAVAGCAVNRAESEPGLLAVAAPIHDARGRVIGAVTISGPAERLEPRLDETTGRLRDAVADLEMRLASRG